jgi:hypothetical protein
MEAIIIISFILILFYLRYNPKLDIAKTNDGDALLLWYDEWVEEEDRCVRKYKVLFKFKNL